MKKIPLLIIIAFSAALFSCWTENGKSNVSGNGKVIINIEIPADKDPGLFLYRIPKTRDAVIDFYSRIAGSRDVALPIINYSEKNNIPLSLSFALVWMESRFNPKAVNRNAHSVDRGLFQLNSKSFYFLKEKDFYNPAINAKYGTAHLKFCLERGKDDIVALAMYNAGTAGVRKGTPVSTLRYISKILKYRDNLKKEFSAEIFTRDNIVLKGTEGRDYFPGAFPDTTDSTLIAENR
ncbi:MAG: lytic transglycosylase domain-containing protein [Spirochaetales bacterium]|nr:lytic transglycosylase domain-containing protein [Spirochaetales bacterium]